MFKDLDERIKIKYIPEILGGRFDYLLQYPQCDKGYAPFELNGVARNVGVWTIASSDTELETAKNKMDERLKQIIAENTQICVRQMPSVNMVDDQYVITVKLAYCNDSEVR